MKIVLKVGTQSILAQNGRPSNEILQKLVDTIVEIKKQHKIVLVSSGAVGSGRYLEREIHNKEYGNTIIEKQFLASLGQPKLMSLYQDLFLKHNILASQVLLTKQDFFTRRNYLNVKNVLNKLLEHDEIIPILNENDSVAIEELMFTDNDELSGLVAAQINADHLVIISNVKGVYDRDPTNTDAKVIPVIDPAKFFPKVSNVKSGLGRGGMFSKLTTAKKSANIGITTHIMSMDNISQLKDIVKIETLGTKILANTKKTNIKKWLAYNNIQTNNYIIIKDDLVDILKDKIVSILPIGIIEVGCDFKKGDVIKILNKDKNEIAVGIAKYDSKKLQEKIGEKNEMEFIHCNYLYVF
jgi:glutamate 5-kinase